MPTGVTRKERLRRECSVPLEARSSGRKTVPAPGVPVVAEQIGEAIGACRRQGGGPLLAGVGWAAMRAFDEITPKSSEEAREKLFHDNPAHLCRWNNSVTA